MSTVVKDTGKDFEPIPTGMHNAVCATVVDLGIQAGFQQKPTQKVMLGFEIDAVRKDGDFAGRRFFVTRSYTASLNEKANLRRDLESWRGKPFTAEQLLGFDIDVLEGKTCTLNLVEKLTEAGKKWVNIASINPHMKDAEKLEPERPGYVPDWAKLLLGQEVDASKADDDEYDDSDIPF